MTLSVPFHNGIGLLERLRPLSGVLAFSHPLREQHASRSWSWHLTCSCRANGITQAHHADWFQRMPQGASTTICTYQDHTTQVLAVGWSPDGRRIASADNTGMVHVWDAATGATVFIYRGHGGMLMNRVNAIGWSPDGKYIASESSDGTVQVWQAP